MNAIAKLKKQYIGGMITLSSGTNEHGETVIITPTDDGFKLTTAQRNGWVRVNQYHWDEGDGSLYSGYWYSEEMFEK